jgi:hypothetical protein
MRKNKTWFYTRKAGGMHQASSFMGTIYLQNSHTRKRRVSALSSLHARAGIYFYEQTNSYDAIYNWFDYAGSQCN